MNNNISSQNKQTTSVKQISWSQLTCSKQ